MIKVSVIVPVYNVEEYLRQCLDSIISQTYSEIEVIVVNDKSPDDSQDIIDEYKSNDSRVVSIIHSKNKGLGGARNTGISAALGDFILFVDSDDWIVETTIEDLTNEITKYDSDIVKFGRIDTYPAYEKIWLPTFKKKVNTDGWGDMKDSVIADKFNPICCTSIYRRDFLINNSIFFPEKLLFEDFYFTFQTNVLAGKLSYLNKPLYHWRKERVGSITYTINERDVEVCNSLQLVDEFLTLHKRSDIINSYEYHLLMYTWSSGTTLYRYFKTKPNKEIQTKVVNHIIKNALFRKHLIRVASSREVAYKMRFSAFLLSKNLALFRLFYKLFLTFRGNGSTETIK